MRRLGFILALLALATVALGEGLFDRQHLGYYIFFRDEGTIIDSTDSKILAYATYHSDTTGQSVAATYADTTWYFTNITWDIYDVFWDSSGTVEQVADNILIPGRVLGDTTITDTLVFGADAVPGYAIIDDAIVSAHIADDQITVDHYGIGSIDSTAIGTAEVGAVHLVASDSYHLHRVDTDSLGVKDSAYTYMEAVAPESLLLPEDGSAAGAPLYITGPADGDVLFRSGGKWINLAKGSDGEVLELSSGLPSWQTDDTGAGGSAYADSAQVGGSNYDFDNYFTADSINGGVIKADAIQEFHFKAVNAPTDEYVLTYEATTGDFEWEADAGATQDFADVLGEDPDGGDIDQTSLGKLEFYDAGLYLDADADGVMDITSDGTLELHSADWDIGATGIATGIGNITSDGTIEGATITEGGVAVYNDNEIDAFSEIDAIVADKSLVNLEDGGTFTGNVIANGNLSVGNATTTAGVLTLLEDDDDGANFASFMVPALAANTVYTLPPDDGDAGEQLQTDGSGVTTWEPSGGSTPDLADVLGQDPDGADIDQTSLGKLEFFDAGLYLDADADGVMDITSDGTLELHSADWDISTTGAITDVSGSNSLWTNDEGYITATLTEEEVEDFVGGMLGGTETGITVTYEDGTNDIDFVVALDVTDLDWANDWMIAYSNGDGLQELAFGDDNGKFLQSQGEGALDFVDIADSDVPDALTLSTVGGAVDMGAATSLEIPNGANPTTNAEGEIAWDSDDDALEVYSGDEGESALIPMYQMVDKTIVLPDSLADEIAILHVDALLYPHGIEIDQVSITLSDDGAYSMVFEEWSGDDPPAAQNDIETVTTGASDSYAEVGGGDIDDAAIDADDYVFLHVPATDKDWVYVQLIFHIKEGD